MTVSMSAVWDRTAEFLGERFGAVVAIAAVALFLPGAIGEILAPVRTPGGLKLALGVLALLLMVPMLWGQLAITALALDPGAVPAAARRRATRRLGATILVMLALVAIGFVLLLPVLAVLAANGVDLARLDQPGALQTLPPGQAAIIALYLLVATPLVLWLIARVAVLAMPVVAAEGLALGALARAYRLSRGLALRIVGVLLLYIGVMWVATSAAETVFGSIFRLIFDGEGAISTAGVLTALVVALVGSIFSVIGTVYAARLYRAALDREAAPPT